VLLQPSVSGRDAEEVRGVEPERLKGLAWWGWNGLVGFDLLLVIKTKKIFVAIVSRRKGFIQSGLRSGPAILIVHKALPGLRDQSMMFFGKK
jgi:hypothetical protein